jgi:hypothetical protein
MVSYNERLGKDILYLGAASNQYAKIIGINDSISIDDIVDIMI